MLKTRPPNNIITEPALYLLKIRAEFPLWGILYDPFRDRWLALRGRRIMLHGSTGTELRGQLLALRESHKGWA
jgi:hypothetical protein